MSVPTPPAMMNPPATHNPGSVNRRRTHFHTAEIAQ
jgi:hypothetical protein